MKQLKLPEFKELLKAQGVPNEDLAFRCPMCGTVQSARDLIRAGAGKTLNEVERHLGFSCVGRWTGAGPYREDGETGQGCDWTLGGLFRMHTLEVVDGAGGIYPRFEPATPEEAKAHLSRNIKIKTDR